MKVVISENQRDKLNNIIYQKIDYMFDIDEMIPVDMEVHRYDVISPNYDIFFKVYLPQYWSDDTFEGNEMKKRSPVLDLEKEYEDKLNSLFGPLWHDQMIKWVENNFPFLPLIKSVGL
jgi:hypothetical protein